jgi:hypothetical protein
MNTKKTGDKAVLQFMTKCAMKDWTVLTPFGDCDRYDLVIDRGNGFERIQVKNGRFVNGAVRFNTSSSHYHTKKGQHTKDFRKDYKGQIEAFGVYCPITDACYIVKVDEVGTSESSLRVDPIKTGSKYPVKWAKDYKV